MCYSHSPMYQCGSSQMPCALQTSTPTDSLQYPLQPPLPGWVLEIRGKAISLPKYTFPIFCHFRAWGTSKDLGKDRLGKGQDEVMRKVWVLDIRNCQKSKFYHDQDKQKICIPGVWWKRSEESVLRHQGSWGQGVQKVDLSTGQAQASRAFQGESCPWLSKSQGKRKRDSNRWKKRTIQEGPKYLHFP